MVWEDFKPTQVQTITLDRLHKMAISNEEAADKRRGLLKSDIADDIIESLKKINKIMNLMHIEDMTEDLNEREYMNPTVTTDMSTVTTDMPPIMATNPRPTITTTATINV